MHVPCHPALNHVAFNNIDAIRREPHNASLMIVYLQQPLLLEIRKDAPGLFFISSKLNRYFMAVHEFVYTAVNELVKIQQKRVSQLPPRSYPLLVHRNNI